MIDFGMAAVVCCYCFFIGAVCGACVVVLVSGLREVTPEPEDDARQLPVAASSWDREFQSRRGRGDADD